MASRDHALNEIKSFFDEKAKIHGATFQSADWNSPERQKAMFQQLLKIWINPQDSASVLDFGCGYGALLDFLQAENYSLTEYFGYDFSYSMIDNALQSHPRQEGVVFTNEVAQLPQADYVIASGIFSIKMGTTEDEWTNHCFETLDQLWGFSRKGMAFNSLTSYSDADKMRPDLYYADPCRFFDYCKTKFSRNVALLHDYELYEFTILVKR